MPITIPKHEPIKKIYVEMVRQIVESEAKNDEDGVLFIDEAYALNKRCQCRLRYRSNQYYFKVYGRPSRRNHDYLCRIYQRDGEIHKDQSGTDFPCAEQICL